MNWWERGVLVALAGVGGGVVAALLRSDLVALDGCFTVLVLAAVVGAVLLLWGVVREFFPSIDHAILLHTLQRHLADPRLLALCARPVQRRTSGRRYVGPGHTRLGRPDI